LIQSRDGPERYGAFSRFDTMPSTEERVEAAPLGRRPPSGRCAGAYRGALGHASSAPATILHDGLNDPRSHGLGRWGMRECAAIDRHVGEGYVSAPLHKARAADNERLRSEGGNDAIRAAHRNHRVHHRYRAPLHSPIKVTPGAALGNTNAISTGKRLGSPLEAIGPARSSCLDDVPECRGFPRRLLDQRMGDPQ
jgi:hypothetical protein